jgi:hypothetical protein
MTDLVAFGNAKLPSVTSLSTALRSMDAGVSDAGMVILKMDKTGHWVYGADQTEVDDTATWAINPFSFVHGFIAWGDGDVLGEKMVPVTEPLPEVDPAPPQAKRGWEVQVGMSLKCMDGEDAGMEAKYSVTSVGGKRAVQKLALDIAAQVEKDQANPVPVVKLKKDHYTHKSYGRIFTPVFEIVKWIGLDGEAAKADDVPASEAPADGAVRRRRSV